MAARKEDLVCLGLRGVGSGFNKALLLDDTRPVAAGKPETDVRPLVLAAAKRWIDRRKEEN